MKLSKGAPVVTTDVANGSSLRYSGPTPRRIREFDLLGIDSPSECAVERETDSFKDDQTAACSRARSMDTGAA